MKVVSVKQVNDTPLIFGDLEVNETHSYIIAGRERGFISHNSMEGILEAADSEVTYISREKSPKRPKELPCDIFNVTVKDQDFVILAGKLNGSVYEIFADEKNGHDFGNAKKGIIIKEGKGEYRLVCDNGMEMKSLAKNFVGTYGVLTRMISLSLRNGVMLTDIIEQLQRSKEFLGFEKAISRVLKYYIKEGEKFDYKEKCSECGAPLVLKDGCPSCASCGWARCG